MTRLTQLSFLLIALTAVDAQAAAILLDAPGDSYTGANGVVFFVPSPGIGSISSGTNNFLTLRDTNDAGDVEAGFNTSADPQTYAGSTNGPQDVVTGGTDDLLTADIPTFTGSGAILANGVEYLEIALSIQEPGAGSIEILELDVGSHSGNGLANFDSQAGTITDIGPLAGDTLTVGDVNAGTNGDLLIYIPKSLVTGVNFLLYAALDNTGGGNENFAARTGDPFANMQPLLVPEPSSLALVALLGGLPLIRRRRQKKMTQPAA